MKIILFIFQIAMAAPELRSAKALKTEFKDNSFSASLSEGFHFNEKAPNGIQAAETFLKPTILLPRNLTIDKLTGSKASGVAHLYVCDDKITYCDMHTVPLGKKKKIAEKKMTESIKGRLDSHGFIVNDFEFAFNKAQKENKMLLVDFGARWCPACLRMESEIFSDQGFVKETASFIKVKVDIDLFSSDVLEEKYNIKGVPTLLFLTPHGQEVTRFYDFQPMNFINDVLSEIKRTPEAIEVLEKKELTPEVKLSLAKRYFFSDQNDKAVHLMEPMNPKPKEYWFAKIGHANNLYKKDPQNRKNQIEVLTKAIASEPESSRSLVWRLNLLEAQSENSAASLKIAQESRELTNKLLTEEELLKSAVQTDLLGEYTGLEGFYVAMMNAEIADLAKVEARQAWEKVIAQGEKYKLSAQTPGASLRLLSAMLKAESFEKALKLVNELLRAKPNDGDLQRRKMRVLIELKKFDEAVAIGQKALKNSYGINEFFVVEPLAKAYISLDKKDLAKKLVSRYLQRNEINFSDLEGIKGRLEKLSLTL